MSEQKKIALIDIGNSKILMGDYTDNEINQTQHFSHDLFIEQVIMGLCKPYDEVLISSVVPDLDEKIKDYLPKATWVTHENITDLTINMKTPEEVGADRLVSALAAYHIHKEPCVIVDAGTALTFCYIDAEGVYQGGAIFPGMGIASKALNDYTAKIPLIYVSPKESRLGKTTEEAVQIGLYAGFYHLIDGIIKDYKELDSNCRVIGTGSGIGLFENKLEIDKIEPHLILKGLAIYHSLQTEQIEKTDS